MFYQLKELEELHSQKIKNHFEDIPLFFNYLYIYEYKMLFISKCRKKYRICCTSACHFEPVVRTQYFDILYFTEDWETARNMFNSYLMRLFWDNPTEKNLDELHSTNGNAS